MLTIVSDLFLTDSFLIKGEIENKYTRLSQMLDEHRRYFIKIRNATLVDLNTCDRIRRRSCTSTSTRSCSRTSSSTAANDHDAHAELYKNQKLNKVRAFFTGHLNIEVGGEVRPGVLRGRRSRDAALLRDARPVGARLQHARGPGPRPAQDPALRDRQQDAPVVHLRLQRGVERAARSTIAERWTLRAIVRPSSAVVASSTGACSDSRLAGWRC